MPFVNTKNTKVSGFLGKPWPVIQGRPYMRDSIGFSTHPKKALPRYWSPAALRSLAVMSVFSHVKPSPFRPKCPP